MPTSISTPVRFHDAGDACIFCTTSWGAGICRLGGSARIYHCFYYQHVFVLVRMFRARWLRRREAIQWTT